MNQIDKQVNELLQKVQKKQISIEEFRKQLDELGATIKIWDKTTERNPRFPEGDNKSRTSFIFNPYYHPKGIFFQTILKKSVLKIIDFVHRSLVKDYDMQAYVYEDERLRTLNNYFRDYINTNFQDLKPYKSDFMNKSVDVFMFLMKEDIYYRARFLDMLNDMPRCELTEIEKENVEKWH